MLDTASNNGLVILSFPPHCSHRLQPPDRTVYGPFKKFVNDAQDAWMRNKPGKTMTIYAIPGIVCEALPKAATPSNIIKGFMVTGIAPYNRNIFNEEDFLRCYATDRPEQNTEEQHSQLG